MTPRGWRPRQPMFGDPKFESLMCPREVAAGIDLKFSEAPGLRVSPQTEPPLPRRPPVFTDIGVGADGPVDAVRSTVRRCVGFETLHVGPTLVMSLEIWSGY